MTKLNLIDVLDEAAIYLDLGVEDKDALMERMAGLVSETHSAAPAEEILQKLKHREGVMSTGIGNRVAVPHVTLEGLDRSRMFLFILNDDVDFEAIDGQPVRVVFLLVVRPDDIAFHLQGLAHIARMARNPGLADDLCGASSKGEVLEKLREIESSAPAGA
ncbi:MAG: PTS sugar transporter subunit IIA [Planctomycetota bacterium]|nr:PTS sugar transporter subunit IIA [Planctomycetota bacterium]